MVRFMSFKSGSSGNCYYIGSEKGGLLVDAGASLRGVKKTLAENGLSLDCFSAILVTHDHFDHVHNLGSYCKKLLRPVYATPRVHAALARYPLTCGVINPCRKDIPVGETVEIPLEGMTAHVRCFSVPHDATETVGYSIDLDGFRFVIMTDVGRMTEEAVDYASKAHALVIESNYDADMLASGPYPLELQDRIRDGHGHMSNDECAEALRRIYHEGLRNVFLCHLSENNNTPELAFAASRAVLDEVTPDEAPKVALRCLPRTYPSQLINLEI